MRSTITAICPTLPGHRGSRFAAAARAGFTAAALLTLAFAGPAAAQEPVGKAVLTKGAVTSSQSGRIRILGKDRPIFANDIITTARRSFVILELTDGTRMNLRPNTVFTVESLEPEAAQPSALMRLFRGGLRAVTGLVSRRNPDGFKLRTSLATIGIRGTDFSARICTEDCAGEEAAAADSTQVAPRSAVVGRVGFLRGRLQATSRRDAQRNLVLGGPLYEGDTLATGRRSFAVLSLKDGSRITLKSDSEFRIERLRYEEDAVDDSSMLMRLLKGGLRAVTGLAKRNRATAFQIATPTATLGIRGTRFDIVCVGDCRGEDSARAFPPGDAVIPDRLAHAQATHLRPVQAGGGATFVRMLDGVVYWLDNGTERPLRQGATAYFTTNHLGPRYDRQLGRSVLDNLGPAPEQIPFDRSLFQSVRRGAKSGTLWTTVHDTGRGGHATVETPDGRRLELGEGESSVLDPENGSLERTEIPRFVDLDEFGRPGGEDGGFACTM